MAEALDTSKRISPAHHAVLDYGVAATYFTLAVQFRRHSASALAWINGGLVLGVSLFTDYPGGVWRKLSFKTHRTFDIAQAVLAATGPLLFGFGGAPEARAFYTQAASEAGVIATTDWDGVTMQRHFTPRAVV